MQESILERLKCYGRGDAPPPDFVQINTTSKSREGWSRAFSPFFLGPCQVTPLDVPTQCHRMENAWQYSKVYADQVGEARRPTHEWTDWSNQGFANPDAVRFPRGKGAKPLYSLHCGEPHGYVQARAIIYAPLYSTCVRTHAAESYEKLKNMVARGDKVVLFDYDGHAKHLAGLTLRQVLHNTRRKMGHSFVLRGMVAADLAQQAPYWETPPTRKEIHATSVPRWRP